MVSQDNLEGKYAMVMYRDMVSDTARTEAYARSLGEVVKEGDTVVDIGTGPFALLACQAARTGAKRVFAIEVDGTVAKSARHFLDASSDPWTSKIEVKVGESATVALPLEADLVVHELIGLIAGCEGAAAILRDAFARHAKKVPLDAGRQWTVPARSRSWLVPVEMPTAQQLVDAGSPDGERRDPLPKDRVVVAIDNFPFACCSMAHPQCFEVLDFAALPSDPHCLTGNQARRLSFICHRAGIFAGFAMFITGEMTSQAVASADAAETRDPASSSYFARDDSPPGIDFCSAWRDSHWGNLVIRLNLVSGNTVHVERGDIVEVDATVDLTPFLPAYSLQARLRQKGGKKEEYIEVLSGSLEQNPECMSWWQLNTQAPALHKSSLP